VVHCWADLLWYIVGRICCGTLLGGFVVVHCSVDLLWCIVGWICCDTLLGGLVVHCWLDFRIHTFESCKFLVE